MTEERVVDNVWLVSALWLGLALAASVLVAPPRAWADESEDARLREPHVVGISSVAMLSFTKIGMP